jgi:hypothetical protein
VILWQDWETLGEAREGSVDTEWRAYSPKCLEGSFCELRVDGVLGRDRKVEKVRRKSLWEG